MKRCETCKWFASNKVWGDAGTCSWSMPDLPFWAEFVLGGTRYLDHREGSNCKMWEKIPDQQKVGFV